VPTAVKQQQQQQQQQPQQVHQQQQRRRPPPAPTAAESHHPLSMMRTAKSAPALREVVAQGGGGSAGHRSPSPTPSQQRQQRPLPSPPPARRPYNTASEPETEPETDLYRQTPPTQYPDGRRRERGVASAPGMGRCAIGAPKRRVDASAAVVAVGGEVVGIEQAVSTAAYEAQLYAAARHLFHERVGFRTAAREHGVQLTDLRWYYDDPAKQALIRAAKPDRGYLDSLRAEEERESRRLTRGDEEGGGGGGGGGGYGGIDEGPAAFGALSDEDDDWE
jgi:hypothetical protein